MIQGSGVAIFGALSLIQPVFFDRTSGLV
jgi:hypothetical protein